MAMKHAWNFQLRQILLALLLAVVATAAIAREDRSQTESTDWWWYHGVTVEFVTKAVQDHNARIVDLEVESTSPYRFSVVMVKNKGAYAKSWWWYYDLAGVGAIRKKLDEHPGARLLDLEVTEVDLGDGWSPRYSAVLVDNSEKIPWRPIYNGSVRDVVGRVQADSQRLVDLESSLFAMYEGEPRISGVTVSATSADPAAWWWYTDLTPARLSSKLKENAARLIDIERGESGKFSVIMHRSRGEHWWYYYARSAEEVTQLVREHSARIIDLETHLVGGKKYFDVVLLKNAPATRVRKVRQRRPRG